MKWEYTTFDISTIQRDNGELGWDTEAWDFVNKMGKEGWEIVHVVEVRRLSYIAGKHLDPPPFADEIPSSKIEFQVYGREYVRNLTFIFKRPMP